MVQISAFSLDTLGTKLREDAITIVDNLLVTVSITNSDAIQINSELRKYENRHKAGFDYDAFKPATTIKYLVTPQRSELLDIYATEVILEERNIEPEILAVAEMAGNHQVKNLESAYSTLLQTMNLLCADYMSRNNRAMLYRDQLGNLSCNPDGKIYGRFSSPLRRLEDLVNLKCLVCAFNHETEPFSASDMVLLSEKKKIAVCR